MEIKDFISPPLRNLTKEVANLTKEMEENPRFSIFNLSLSLSKSRALAFMISKVSNVCFCNF
jgi:hypothetical protein